MSLKNKINNPDDKIMLILNTPLPTVVQYGILGITIVVVVLFVICFNINIVETINGRVIPCNNIAVCTNGSKCVHLLLQTSPSDEINISQLIEIKKRDNVFLATIIDKSKPQSQEMRISVNIDQSFHFIENEEISVILKVSIGKFLFTSLKF
jgi:hypothetical protein